jgi:hypothetical protein
MSHPFPVVNNADDTCWIAMMHNGVLECVSEDKEDKLSDTAILLRDVITPQLVDYPDLMLNPSWLYMAGEMIGNPNKLVFMRGDGKVSIVNDWQGKWHEGGVWYSNEYSVDPPTPAVTYNRGGLYGSGVYRHYDWGDDYTDYSGSCYNRGSVGANDAKPRTTWSEFLHGFKDSGWEFDERLKKWIKDGKVPDDGSKPTVVSYQGEFWLQDPNGTLIRRYNSEPLDSVEEKKVFLLDDKDTPKVEDDDDQYDDPDEDDARAFVEQVYDMSDTEVYNYVMTASPEMITEVILELAGGKSSLYR